MRSSLGFHTMTLSKELYCHSHTNDLINDFKKYCKKTKTIKIYPDKNENIAIDFYREDKGIKWVIKRNILTKKSYVDIVEVTINPKILGGIQSYITAATYDDMKTAIENFNSISKSISPLLHTFADYKLKRLDYCVNFSINELLPGCIAEQIMDLIKRSDIPPRFKEWVEYDRISHRTKSKPSSFYLMNHSVHINCYSKYMQLLEKSKQNEEKNYPPIPVSTLEAARDMIRFEVQCKYIKTYNLSQKVIEDMSLLKNETCYGILRDYFRKTVGGGDWYTLQEAIRIIKFNHFNQQKERRLIEALQFVNQCRSVSKAKQMCSDDELEKFKRTLTDISDLRINPVTIPKEWGIKHIQNLLDAYDRKESAEELENNFDNYFKFRFINI